MFLSTFSTLLCAWFAFLLPCYATFKVLSRRPLNEPDLQRWAMYWSVIGAFVAFEYAAEWLISWLPFYWEVKTAFLLFLSLPQTQGSTYIYLRYLQPFFLRNEKELDEGIVALQRNVLVFLQAKLTALWEFFCSISTKQRTITPGTTPVTSLPPWLSSDLVHAALNIFYPSSTVGPTAPAQETPEQKGVVFSDTSKQSFPTPEENFTVPPSVLIQ